MGLWSDIVRRGTTGQYRKEDEEEMKYRDIQKKCDDFIDLCSEAITKIDAWKAYMDSYAHTDEDLNTRIYTSKAEIDKAIAEAVADQANAISRAEVYNPYRSVPIELQ